MRKEERKQPPDTTSLIEQAYKECYEYLVECAQRLGFSYDMAEDLVQDAFLLALQKPEEFLVCQNRTAWLSEFLRNCIGHHYREMQYLNRLQTQLEQFTSGMTEDQLEVATLYKGMIDDEDLELLILYYLEGYSYDELSIRFDIKQPTLRKRIQRAKERFRRAIGEEK